MRRLKSKWFDVLVGGAIGVAAVCYVHSVASLQGGEVKVLMTKVDDIKHVQDGIHEDGSLTLLREGSISLNAVEPGWPVKIAVDRSAPEHSITTFVW